MDPHTLDPILPIPTSIYKLTRNLKRADNTLFNALRSIYEDSRFVAEIRQLWPSLPLLANLRCGLWFAPSFDATCYFKSTDGHAGNWSFSLTRLNMHVVAIAGSNHGCLIVDATRKGKRFPDSMGKTVPIWCCVVNRAVAKWRRDRGARSEAPPVDLPPETMPLSSADVPAGNAAIGDGDQPFKDSGASTTSQERTEEWDIQLHLPLWISDSERRSIEPLLDTWANQLLSSGADVASASSYLSKPLRPLWVSQRSRIWKNYMPSPNSLTFTPIILVSASASRGAAGGGGGGGRRRSAGLEDSEEDPVWDAGMATGEGGRGGGDRTVQGRHDGQEAASVVGDASPHIADWEWDDFCWSYIPGAADDEESWSRGLGPPLFWRFWREILGSGPQRCNAKVAQLVEEERVRLSRGRGEELPQRRAKRSASDRGGAGGGGGGAGDGVSQPPCASDPRSFFPPAAPAVSPAVSPGVCQVGTTRVAIADMSKADMAALLSRFDAAIVCAPDAVAFVKSMAGSQDPLLPSERTADQEHLSSHPQRGSESTRRWQDTCSGHCHPETNSNSTRRDDTSSCYPDTVPLHAGPSLSLVTSCSGCSVLPLAVQLPRKDRSSLSSHLPPALAFATHCLQASPTSRLLIACQNGYDVSVAVCLAVLILCYDETGSLVGHSNRWREVTKPSIRQTLAYICSYHCDARPSRASIRQVFNYFLGLSSPEKDEGSCIA